MADEKALFHISYGIFLLTAQWEGRRAGCLVNTVFQVTAQPIRIAVSVAKANQTHELMKKKGSFAVTVLDLSAPTELLGNFGYRSSAATDKFAQVRWEKDSLGNPRVLESGAAYLACEIEKALDLETHTLFVCRVVEAEEGSGGEPMTYHYYRKVKKGQAGRHAPTYVAQEKKESRP